MNPPPQPPISMIHKGNFMSDVEDALSTQKIPNLVLQAISVFAVVYTAGISVAGANAWAWSALPATIAALARLALKSMTGQTIHEDVIRELVAKNTSAVPRPAPGMLRQRIPDTRAAAAPPPPAPPSDTPPAANP